MVKTFLLKNIPAQNALEQLHQAGIIDYMFNWGYTADEKRNTLTITLKYGGGSNPEREKEMMKQIEAFIRAVDIPSD